VTTERQEGGGGGGIRTRVRARGLRRRYMLSPYSFLAGGGQRTALSGHTLHCSRLFTPEGGGMEASLHCVALYNLEGEG